MPARPPLNSAIPAAADPARPRKRHVTAAVTGPGAIKDNSFLFHEQEPAMPPHPEIPDLLEQYMKASGSAECWVTVRELRSFFGLEDAAGPAFSGFLQKIHFGPFFSCRYKVVRMEKFRDTTPPYRIIKKYLVQERPVKKNTGSPGSKNSSGKTGKQVITLRDTLLSGAGNGSK
jgi:hypothetical protein